MARKIGDGGWCWFADPRAVYHAGRHRRTYIGWVDRRGEIMVGSFDHATNRIERAVLHRGFSVDDHHNPALLLDADGHITVYYCAHNGGRMYHRRSLEPEDVTGWGPEQTLGTNTKGDRGYSYPNPMYLSAERRTYLFWRGGAWWPAFSRRTDGGSWSRAKTLLRIPDQRPYVKVHDDGVRNIHIAYTEGNPGSFNNSIYYLRYHDDALHRADGSRVATLKNLPISPSRGDRVYDARATGVRAWIWDIATFRDGRPVLVYALFPGSTDCIYVYAEWTSGRWLAHHIVNAAGRIGGNYAPGIALDHENPHVVYLSRREGGRFVVQRWRTADHGATWHHRTIPRGSLAGDGLRPFTPHGRGTELDVLWMQGTYVGYTDYRTDLVGHFSRK